MAIAGSEEKEIVKQKILEVFSDSFVYDKEIRIPLNGRQIKVTLTCAKVNVESGSDVKTPAKTRPEASQDVIPANYKITEEEKAEVQELMNFLGEK